MKTLFFPSLFGAQKGAVFRSNLKWREKDMLFRAPDNQQMAQKFALFLKKTCAKREKPREALREAKTRLFKFPGHKIFREILRVLFFLTMMQLGFPTAHRLTFLSSPPVTRTRPDLWPRARQFTLAPWATNSSENEEKTHKDVH